MESMPLSEKVRCKQSLSRGAFCCPTLRFVRIRLQHFACMHARCGCKGEASISVRTSSKRGVQTGPACIYERRWDQGSSTVGAAACPLINVVDFSRLRTPPLSAEDLLDSQENTDNISVQVHASSVAATLAADEREQHLTKTSEAPDCKIDNAGVTAASERNKTRCQFSRKSVANLRNYRALLFYTSWDSRSQALLKTLTDLANINTPLQQQCQRGNRHRCGGGERSLFHKGSPPSSEEGGGLTGDNAEETSGTEPTEDSGTRMTVLSGVSHSIHTEAEELNGKAEGLESILKSCVPCWLPVTGVRVYNSLVVAAGRRALQKQTRMLTNLRQLRHHERALNLMVREGICYGAGLLPALQIWRKDSGSQCVTEVPASADSGIASGLESPNVPGGRSLNGVIESRPSSSGWPGPKAGTKQRWEKVLDVRGVGPVPLVELAGYDAAAWREEEDLLLRRALLQKPREPGEAARQTDHTECKGILSRGSGGFASRFLEQETVQDDLRTWLFQVSTLYQYHAMRILLKRLRYAEDEFPEFEEFNIRKFNPRIAKLRGLLKD